MLIYLYVLIIQHMMLSSSEAMYLVDNRLPMTRSGRLEQPPLVDINNDMLEQELSMAYKNQVVPSSRYLTDLPANEESPFSLNQINLRRYASLLQNKDLISQKNTRHYNDYSQGYLSELQKFYEKQSQKRSQSTANNDQNTITENDAGTLSKDPDSMVNSTDTLSRDTEVPLKDTDITHKRVFNESETVVEVIGDENANNTISVDSDLESIPNLESSNDTSVNETQEFQDLLEEARKTKEQIERLSAKLNDDSDEMTAKDNETTASKKSNLDNLQNDISVERGVRQLLVKHLIQVQIEDRHREEALESMLKHFPIENNALRSWNITQGALKAILRAKVNLMDPENRLLMAKKLSRIREMQGN
ncbi:uncharacterized protein LOC130621561 [Hydractinia symbiolongicarpus]|uniref:uncharacterized protein LOC130621561 n=1 Tax=Hydractinia symbiolongicarpus TaxID=13093 RepID=UPI00254E6651|nr:uncharacterized protein LOC130621561 [Hydractinia symbiolongicarpus]